MLIEVNSCCSCNIFMVLDDSICLCWLWWSCWLCMGVWRLVYSKVWVITFMSSHVGVNFAAHFLCVWAAGSFQLKFIIHGWGELWAIYYCVVSETMFNASYIQLWFDEYWVKMWPYATSCRVLNIMPVAGQSANLEVCVLIKTIVTGAAS